MAIEAHVHRLSNAEYTRMVDAGALEVDAGVDGVATATVVQLLASRQAKAASADPDES